MKWVIKKLLTHNRFSKKQAKAPRTHICYHDNNIATVEKGLIDNISPLFLLKISVSVNTILLVL